MMQEETYEATNYDEASRCDWVFGDTTGERRNIVLADGGRRIRFHPYGSHGTECARGNVPMTVGIHRWAIQMGPTVYGTDMTVGVCTDKLDLHEHEYRYGHVVGSNEHGWGMSYHGVCRHNECKTPGDVFGRHSIIELTLDMKARTLTASVDNRSPVFISSDLWHGARCPEPLYPVVASTAARSEMTLLWSRCELPTLQICCIRCILAAIYSKSDISDLPLPGKLKKEIMTSWAPAKLDNTSVAQDD